MTTGSQIALPFLAVGRLRRRPCHFIESAARSDGPSLTARIASYIPGVRLYTQYYVSGITVAELSPLERGRLFNNELRSQQAATHLVSQLELDRIAGQ